MGYNTAAVHNAAQEAAGLLLEFPDRMKRAPILEKKLMIRRLVQSIVIDREAEQVEVTLRRLPRTNNPILKSILQDGVVQSSVCPEQGTHLIERVLENPLILKVSRKLLGL